jgi:hypothetical protein
MFAFLMKVICCVFALISAGIGAVMCFLTIVRIQRYIKELGVVLAIITGLVSLLFATGFLWFGHLIFTGIII